MRIDSGNPTSFTPDHTGWTATFNSRTNDETWDLPVIGWAVVTRWTEWQEKVDGNPDGDRCETSIEAVVLAESAYPTTVAEYLHDLETPTDTLRAVVLGSLNPPA